MDIHLTSFPASARTARGAIVAIDAFRAFTTAAYAFASGAAEIIMVAELDEARALKQSGRADISIGERGGLKPDDFDLPNSPTIAAESDFTGKRLVQTTTNGTAALAAAPEDAEIFAAALVNARATGNALRGVGEATIIAAGRKGETRAPEDELCATYIKVVAAGEAFDPSALWDLLQRWFANEAFLTGRAPYGPATDWLLALELDRFDFAIKVTRQGGLLVARAA